MSGEEIGIPVWVSSRKSKSRVVPEESELQKLYSVHQVYKLFGGLFHYVVVTAIN